jgi:hypothetical protein
MAKKSGKDFQREVLNDPEWVKEHGDVDKFEDIDSKVNTEYSSKRKEKTSLINKNRSGKYQYDSRSALKGDTLMYKGKKKIVSEYKNYDSVRSLFKPPSIYDMSKFMKTNDSNIRYASEQKLDFISNDTKNYYDNFFNQIFNGPKIHTLETTNEPIPIGFLDYDSFLELICSIELGFAYKEFGVEKMKNFVCLDNTNKKYMKDLDLTKVINKGDIVKLSIWIDPTTRYSYLIYTCNDEPIYILSQRKNVAKANCAFIPNSKFVVNEKSRKSI